MKLLKSARGPKSRNSKHINAAVAAYLAIPESQRPHGTKRRIREQFGVSASSFSSGLQRAQAMLAATT